MNTFLDNISQGFWRVFWRVFWRWHLVWLAVLFSTAMNGVVWSQEPRNYQWEDVLIQSGWVNACRWDAAPRLELNMRRAHARFQLNIQQQVLWRKLTRVLRENQQERTAFCFKLRQSLEHPRQRRTLKIRLKQERQWAKYQMKLASRSERAVTNFYESLKKKQRQLLDQMVVPDTASANAPRQPFRLGSGG